MNSKKTVLCVSIMLTCFIIAFIFHCYSANVDGHSQVTRSNRVEKRVSSKKIQDIQVGDRTTGKNPKISEVERRSFLPEPTPDSWKVAVLEMQKPDGNRLDLTLLRPLEWFELVDAKVGEQVFIDLPEMGVQSNAKLLAIEPCPTIKAGEGNVVTGTFRHQANATIDLFVDVLDKPIGCTDTHPFWSVSREEFIDAGKLRPGEELQLCGGQLAKVIQIQSRPGPQFVYNIEVLNENVYEVSWLGILVHNACEYFTTKSDNAGRITDASFGVSKNTLDSGKRTTAETRQDMRDRLDGLDLDDAGHIAARVLGGQLEGNLVPMSQKLNRKILAPYERKIAQYLRKPENADVTIEIRVTFEYEGTSKRPTKIKYEPITSNGFVFDPPFISAMND